MFTIVLSFISLGYDMGIMLMQKFMVLVLMVTSMAGYGSTYNTFLHEFEPRDKQFPELIKILLKAEPHSTVNVRVQSPGGMSKYMYGLLIVSALAHVNDVRINWYLNLAGSAGALVPWMDIPGHVYYSERSWVIFHSERMINERPNGTFTYVITEKNKESCWAIYTDKRYHFPLYDEQITAMCANGADVTVYPGQLEAFNKHPCFSGDQSGKLENNTWCEYIPKTDGK